MQNTGKKKKDSAITLLPPTLNCNSQRFVFIFQILCKLKKNRKEGAAIFNKY